MSSPEKEGWTNWFFTPHKIGYKSGSGSAANTNSKGRGRIQALSKEENIANADFIMPNSSGNAQAHLEEQQKNAKKLENELLEYQYNMGLLVLEKKDWASKYEELKQQIDEANATLKVEQAAHANDLLDCEKSVYNLRKALGVEKQCVVELEKALHDLRSKNAETQFTSESKLAEASALMESLESKSLEVEVKLHHADAKLAEVSRKSSELERKLQELETRENALSRERQSLYKERDMNEIALSRQREEVREWERRLLEGEERLAEGSAILNQREERVNEHVKILDQKEKDLQEAAKKIDMDSLDFRKKLDHLNDRTTSLAVKEQEVDEARRRLEVTEKTLLSLEERLNVKEKEEMQKRLKEHNVFLDAKREEFELEIGQKKIKFDEELKKKLCEAERMEAEAKHRDEKLTKSEAAAEKKLEKLRDKEKDLELKAKSLKEREKNIKEEEKRIELANKELIADKEGLVHMEAQIETERANNEKQLLKINEEKDMLIVSEEERSEFLRLQAQLKHEIENCKIQNELILKEAETLKLEKTSFEKEWEELDEKRSRINSEMEKLNVEKENLQKTRQLNDEKAESERKATHDFVQRELVALQFDKESFEASMVHEKSVLVQKTNAEKDELLRDFEFMKAALEADMRKRQEEEEQHLHERERLFEEERDKKLITISHLRESAHKEMEETKLEKLKLEREKKEIAEQKKYFERHQLEMRKDIDQLVALSGKLKAQREQFTEERDRFLSFVGKFKSCENCRELTSEYILSDLLPFSQIANSEVPPIPRLNSIFLKDRVQDIAFHVNRHDGMESPVPVGSGSPSSSQKISWLRRCTSKIFNLSPSKQIELVTGEKITHKEPATEETAGKDLRELIVSETEQELSAEDGAHSLDARAEMENRSSLEMGPSMDICIHEEDNLSMKKQTVESEQRDLVDGKHEQGVRRRARFRRTRSVKDVVEHASTLYQTRQEHQDEYQNGDANAANSSLVGSGTDTSLAEDANVRNRRKRNHTSTSQTTMSEESELPTGNVSEVNQRRRRQKVGRLHPNSGETRYNLRTRPIISDSPVRVKRGSTKTSKGTGGEDIEGGQKSEAPPVGVVNNQKGISSELQLQSEEGTHDDNADHATLDVVNNNMGSAEASTRNEDWAGDDSDKQERTESDSGGSKVEVEDDSEDDSEEDEQPGEASIGKKLWNFLTS